MKMGNEARGEDMGNSWAIKWRSMNTRAAEWLDLGRVPCAALMVAPMLAFNNFKRKKTDIQEHTPEQQCACH